MIGWIANNLPQAEARSAVSNRKHSALLLIKRRTCPAKSVSNKNHLRVSAETVNENAAVNITWEPNVKRYYSLWNECRGKSDWHLKLCFWYVFLLFLHWLFTTSTFPEKPPPSNKRLNERLKKINKRRHGAFSRYGLGFVCRLYRVGWEDFWNRTVCSALFIFINKTRLVTLTHQYNLKRLSARYQLVINIKISCKSR